MAGTQHLYQMVHEKILERIRNGEFLPGDKLPSEKDLTCEYNVSQITAKQAMALLAEEGIIFRRPGLGSFVAETPQNTIQLRNDRAAPSAGKLLGLVMEDFSPSYGLELLQAIERHAGELGYDLCIKRSLGDQEKEAQDIEALVAAGAKGIVVMPTHGKGYNHRILRLVVDGFPLVFMDRYLNGILAPYIGSENYQSTMMLMEYLFEKGHRQIAMVTPQGADATTIRERISGYIDAYKAHGYQRNKRILLDDVRSTIPNLANADGVQGDVEKIAAFLLENSEVSAVVASEYGIACMVLRACESIKKPVPDAISIVCFDDLAPEYSGGFFTHIRQNEAAIGREAVTVLCRSIENGVANDVCSKVFTGELIEGRSVARHCN